MNATFLIGAAEGVQWGDFLFYLLTFVVLIAAVKHFAWGPVTEMMEKRANKIANDIDSAEDARKKAEELAAQREEALKDSHVEASRLSIVRSKTANSKRQASLILLSRKS